MCLDVSLCRQQFTDVSIRVGRAVFRCHRVVLCAMSTFFHRLLSEDDTDRRLVIFQNADAGVFEEVLEYIYTGKLVIGDNFGDFLKLVMKLEMQVRRTRVARAMLSACRNRQ